MTSAVILVQQELQGHTGAVQKGTHTASQARPAQEYLSIRSYLLPGLLVPTDLPLLDSLKDFPDSLLAAAASSTA